MPLFLIADSQRSPNASQLARPANNAQTVESRTNAVPDYFIPRSSGNALDGFVFHGV
jgi:hypothetical protein